MLGGLLNYEARGQWSGKERVLNVCKEDQRQGDAGCTDVVCNSPEQFFFCFDLKKLYQYEELCLFAFST